MCFSLRLTRRRPCSDSNLQDRHCETTVSLSLCISVRLQSKPHARFDNGETNCGHMSQPQRLHQLLHLSRAINKIVHMFACPGFKAFRRILTSESRNSKHTTRIAGRLISLFIHVENFFRMNTGI
jgi:hypothetical protein